MTPEPLHARVEPMVLPLGAASDLVAVGRDGHGYLPVGAYEVIVRPRAGGDVVLPAAVEAEGRPLAFRYEPRTTGECAVTLRFPGGSRHGAGSFYVVPADLARRLPLRGDLHTHTWYSDGRSSPSELVEAAAARGLDFLAVTDHDNWEGSADARRAAAGMAEAPAVLSGEEVTFERGHLVAVGTRGSVADRRRRPGYADEVAAIQAEIAAAAAPLEQLARAVWSARQIRELGGLAFVAHPFWVADGEYHLDWRLCAELLRRREVDGVELLGDVDFEDNLLSVAGYMELLAEGVSTTVVGNSDTHGIEHTLGRYWSMVFASGPSEGDIMDALRERRSVACCGQGDGQVAIYGPLDLVQYAYFLHREVLPRAQRAAGSGPAARLGGVRRLLGLS